MAPLKKKVVGKSPAAIEDGAAAAMDVTVLNTGHLVNVQEALSDILAHDVFTDILTVEGLDRGVEGDKCGKPGYKTRIRQDLYEEDMNKAGLVELSSNFFDQDWRFSTTPGHSDARCPSLICNLLLPSRVCAFVRARGMHWYARVRVRECVCTVLYFPHGSVRHNARLRTPPARNSKPAARENLFH